MTEPAALAGIEAPDRDEVSEAELRGAVRARLPEWSAWLEEIVNPNRPTPRRSDMAHAVRAMCQCLCTLETGKRSDEDAAAGWALQSLPDPWRATVERAQGWRSDPIADASANHEVRRFVTWAIDRARSTGAR